MEPSRSIYERRRANRYFLVACLRERVENRCSLFMFQENQKPREEDDYVGGTDWNV